MPRVGCAPFVLVGLAGCAGVLGFEDIVEDEPVPAPDGGLESSSPATSSSSSGGADASEAGAPPKCDATTPFGPREAVQGLRDEMKGEAWPRLSSDELTIVFERAVSAAVFRAYIARRKTKTDAFEPAVPLPDYIFTPSLSRDGKRLYFTNVAETNVRTLASAPVDSAMTPDLSMPFAKKAEDVFPVRAEATNETFFASNREQANPVGGKGPFSLYRVTGAFGKSDAMPEPLVVMIPASAGGGDLGKRLLLEPVLSADGLDLYFTLYAEDGITAQKLFVMSRPAADGPFGIPTEVGGIDPATTRLGWLSDDNCRAYGYGTEPGSTLTHLFTMNRRPN